MTDSRPVGAADLFRAVGLRPDGPAILGRPMRASGPGIYVVELPAPRATAPIDHNRIAKWIQHVPQMRLDGEEPTSKHIAARLASFWLPSQTVLYVGTAAGSIAGRIAALEKHVLGDRRPHAAAHWLKTLDVNGLRVWWAETDAAEEYEDGLLGAFAEGIGDVERGALHDSTVALPFANLRSTGGQSKRHGITRSVLPEEIVAPLPATRVVDVPAGDADGARAEERGTGTTRRTGKAPAARKPATPRAPKPMKRAADPVLLTADGLAHLEAELAELVARRPGVVSRIRSAKELGDLKENSDYHAAREEQGFLEGRIQAIEAQLRAAVVVAAPTDKSRVVLGSRVTVDSDGEERVLSIVGTTESSPAAGRISVGSPVAQALLGRSAGDEAVVRTPGGEVRYRIIAID
ncbi:MAG TPA: transcription elongation factor GreA [Candidatus Limnocylindrales bacterium]|nr:transcription elongation factor GreA [Candidatus Limnocylindrales bacterium]